MKPPISPEEKKEACVCDDDGCGCIVSRPSPDPPPEKESNPEGTSNGTDD